jgi:hypothetical protein
MDKANEALRLLEEAKQYLYAEGWILAYEVNIRPLSFDDSRYADMKNHSEKT